MNKKKITKKIKQYLLISFGVLLLDLGFYFFIEPSKIVLGGMMGISIILEPFYTQLGTWFTTSLFLLIANVITLIIGGFLLGKDFFVKTIFSSVFSPFVVFILESFFDPNLFLKEISESGYYLISLVCGSLLSGLGLGIAIKNNGSTGGMDVIQRMMSKYMHIPYSKTMYLTDWVIVFISGFTFAEVFSFNIEKIVYGIAGVFLISILIDAIILNAKRRRTAYIITNKPEDVKSFIYEKINRGVTYVDVKGGYSGSKMTMIVCTMEKNEAYRLTQMLDSIDPESFCFITSTREIVGEYVK